MIITRNRKGINFDAGFPLENEDDLKLLYVDSNPIQRKRLSGWLKSPDSEPLVLVGQIGTGKTTTIAMAFADAGITPDIKLSLDTDTSGYTPGAYWGLFLGHILKAALQLGIDPALFGFSGDLFENNFASVREISELLKRRSNGLADFNKKKRLLSRIEASLEYIQPQLRELIATIEQKNGRRLFVFAEGIDKFKIHTPDYESLIDLLDFLSRYKTLFEANLLHLFGERREWKSTSKLILTATKQVDIISLMRRRMGVYASSRETIYPILASLSGGNPRQALRLLIEHEFALNAEMEIKQCLDYACQRVRDDYLNTISDLFDPELLKVIDRDRYIKTGTLTGFDSRAAAQEAVYQNWIIIEEEPDHAQNWQANINPLLQPAIQTLATLPETLETKLLREWALDHDTSPFGLDFNIESSTPKHYIERLHEEKIHSDYTITEVFDRMAAYFIEPSHKEKIIVSFKNRDLVELSNDFVLGRAGTFNPLRFKDVKYEEEPDMPVEDWLLFHLHEESFDGYSIRFYRNLSERECTELDQKRDAFLDFNMIWWIEEARLRKYLPFWPQLKQFFKILHLEEEVLSNITPREIEDDLEDLESNLEELDNTKGTKAENLKQSVLRLKNVLLYLKKKNHG